MEWGIIIDRDQDLIEENEAGKKIKRNIEKIKNIVQDQEKGRILGITLILDLLAENIENLLPENTGKR